MHTRNINYTLVQTELFKLLSATGLASQEQCCRQLGISQPVFSRLVKKLGDTILVTGRASSTRYAARRTIHNADNQIPLYQIDGQGNATHIVTLHAIGPRGFYVEPHHNNIKAAFYDDLPYFLDDLRPSGFLGRLIPNTYPQLNAPADIRLWSADDCLRFFTQFGWDLVGNLIVGDPAFQNYLANPKKNATTSISAKTRKTKYELLAQNVLHQGPAGSSAAGEQPKFLTTVSPHQHVMVKFTPPLRDKLSQRRADLLVCEHISHFVLNKFGIPAAQSSLVTGKDRLFLEIVRFDRTNTGRLGVISINALNLEFVGSTGKWKDISKGLLAQGHITTKAHKLICWLDLFGRLIANTDRHAGNLSFFTDHFKITGLAPTYDMLPMFYAPQHEQILDQEFVLSGPEPGDAAVWQEAWKAAVVFWKNVAAHKMISRTFKTTATRNAQMVEKQKSAYLKLPAESLTR